MTSAPSPALRRELGWLAATAFASLLLGLLVQQVAILLPLGLALHAAWLLWRLEALLRWLQDGARASQAPPTVGLDNGLVELVHRMKKDSRKRKHRYRNALAQFTDLAKALPDATVVMNAQREIRWANEAARTLLNVAYETDRGQRIDNLVRAPGFVDALVEGSAEQDVEVELPAGSGRTLAVRVVPSSNAMSLLIARDVTQRVKVREMRKRFVDDVSHELRTPLTVIEGYVEMLRDGDALDPNTRDALDRVAEQSGRMHHIVEHLLQLSRLEGDPLAEGEGERVEVASMLGGIVATVGALRPGGGPRFTLEADETLAVLGSESEIWSACNNLVVNAAKYGGGRARARRLGSRRVGPPDLHRRGRRSRNRGAPPAPPLRAVLPGRPEPLAPLGRHRARARHRQARDPAPRRAAPARERPGTRLDLRDRVPGRAGAPPRRRDGHLTCRLP